MLIGGDVRPMPDVLNSPQLTQIRRTFSTKSEPEPNHIRDPEQAIRTEVVHIWRFIREAA